MKHFSITNKACAIVLPVKFRKFLHLFDSFLFKNTFSKLIVLYQIKCTFLIKSAI